MILWYYVCLFLLRFRLYAFVEAAALRSIVLRYAGAPIIATRIFFYFLFRDVVFPFFESFFVPLPLSRRMESTPYVLFLPKGVFLWHTLSPRAGLLTSISLLCDNSINQSTSTSAVKYLRAKVLETLLYGCVTWGPRACHYDTLRRAHHMFLIRCIGWRKHKRADHPISYLNQLIKTGSESIEATLRRRGGSCLRDLWPAWRIRDFGINADQWATAAQDEGEWRRTAEQGAENFMAKWIVAEKSKAGLRHAVVCPHETGKIKKRIAQSKQACAGSLALIDQPQVGRTCILRGFGLQTPWCLSLVLRLFCFSSFSSLCFR